MRKSTMPRKMSDSTPLKGLPSRTLGNAGFRNQRPNLQNRSNRKTEGGGVKLLDITEQPIGYAAAKKRKRQQELEEMQAAKLKKDQENKEQKSAAANEAVMSSKEEKSKQNASAAVSTSTSSANAPTATKSTPDYAAGLSTFNPPTPAPPPPPAYAPPTPAYAPPQPSSLPAVTTVVPASATTSTISHPPNVQSLLQSQRPIPPLPQRLATTMAGNPSGMATVVVAQPGGIRNAIPAGLSTLEPLPQAAVRGSITNQPPP